MEVDSSLYQTDFSAWLKDQAELLRHRQFNQIDAKNLIEELEEMGRSEESALESAIREALMHLLKLSYSNAMDPRNGWLISVNKQRKQIDRVLKKNPGLKSKISELFLDAWKDAREQAIFECSVYNENISVPDDPIFTFQNVTDTDYFPAGPDACESQFELDQ